MFSLAGMMRGTPARSSGQTLSFAASSLSVRTKTPQRSLTGVRIKLYLVISTGSCNKPISKRPRSIRSLMLSALPL